MHSPNCSGELLRIHKQYYFSMKVKVFLLLKFGTRKNILTVNYYKQFFTHNDAISIRSLVSGIASSENIHLLPQLLNGFL
jgi:hypothetical protein